MPLRQMFFFAGCRDVYDLFAAKTDELCAQLSPAVYRRDAARAAGAPVPRAMHIFKRAAR